MVDGGEMVGDGGDNQEEEEILIGSGGFGLMVYKIATKNKVVKKGKTDKGFIGINYIADYKVILAATLKRIELFNPEDLEQNVEINGQSIESINTSLNGQYLSDLAVSDSSLKGAIKYIALGDEFGQI